MCASAPLDLSTGTIYRVVQANNNYCSKYEKATVTESGTKFSGTNGFNRLVVPIPDSKTIKKGCFLVQDW